MLLCEITRKESMPAWQIALYAATGVSVVLTGISVFMFIRSKKSSK